MSVVDFDPPERFVAGTVGPPGQRVFFLQASDSKRTVSVSLEKEQVRLLGQRLSDLVGRLPEAPAIDEAAKVLVDNDPLTSPIEDEFRVDTLALSWDQSRHVIVVEAFDSDPEETADAGVQSLRVTLSPRHALAFARRCDSVVRAGRPNCPFCSLPLDPQGHICPRANGYRR
ncbi:DUF3090 family protein [Kribbia dieselivorans]|uniref:DUF3090 family protein n=1 Tax=Kribbia dieselivorans TaxID=331526 RepID=UPI000838F535|nr:DUF3090 family protein [Kribbia dieselivorans]